MDKMQLYTGEHGVDSIFFAALLGLFEIEAMQGAATLGCDHLICE